MIKLRKGHQNILNCSQRCFYSNQIINNIELLPLRLQQISKQMSDFWARAKKINSIETINSDPLLSQFRHHFTIMKVHLPRKMNLQSFAERVPSGFGLPSNSFSHSVYIAQFINVYDHDLVDIAIGFRRDEIAIQIATGKLEFKNDNQTCKVELSNGFKIFMQQLRSQQNQGKNNENNEVSVKAQNINNEELKKKQSQIRLEKKDSKVSSMKNSNNNRQRSKSRSRSHSRSRSESRSREKKKQIFHRISSGSQTLHLQKSLSERLEPQKWK